MNTTAAEYIEVQVTFQGLRAEAARAMTLSLEDLTMFYNAAASIFYTFRPRNDDAAVLFANEAYHLMRDFSEAMYAACGY